MKGKISIDGVAEDIELVTAPLSGKFQLKVKRTDGKTCGFQYDSSPKSSHSDAKEGKYRAGYLFANKTIIDCYIKFEKENG